MRFTFNLINLLPTLKKKAIAYVKGKFPMIPNESHQRFGNKHCNADLLDGRPLVPSVFIDAQFCFQY